MDAQVNEIASEPEVKTLKAVSSYASEKYVVA
jgi:hypothetical protein